SGERFARLIPQGWNGLDARGHDYDTTDNSAGCIAIAEAADGGPKSLFIIVEVASGGPEAERHGILSADLGTVSQCCDSRVHGRFFGEIDRMGDATLHFAFGCAVADVLQKVARSEWRSLVAACERACQCDGDCSGCAFRVTV